MSHLDLRLQNRHVLCLCSSFLWTSDPSTDVSSPSHLASDSDSEVYCDSVDQFGQEEVRVSSSSTQQLELVHVDDFFYRL